MKIRVSMTIILVMVCCSACSNKMNQVYSDDNIIISDFDTYGLDEKDIRVDDDNYSGTVKISGSYSIWKYECEEDKEIDISYLFSATSGKAKLVLITPDNEIQVLASNDEDVDNEGMQQTTVSLKKGLNRIKLVGKNKADVELELEIPDGTFIG